MHPKTFHVIIRRPYGLVAPKSYVFHTHAQTRHEALDWVARVFSGVDIGPTLRRWAQPPSAVPRIGNGDPVVVQDCDSFRVLRRVGGKTVSSEAPLGLYRRSVDDVEADTLKIFHFLQADRAQFLLYFERLSSCYQHGGAAWYLERLGEIKQAHALATRWQERVWAEYWPTQQGIELVLPHRSMLAA